MKANIIKPTFIVVSFVFVGMYWHLANQTTTANHGQFYSILDDSYIHLSLVFNLFTHGLCSGSLSSFSAPASSFLWPLLLLPTALLPNKLFLLMSLVNNLVFTLVTLFVWQKFWQQQILQTLPCKINQAWLHLTCCTHCCILIIVLNLLSMTFYGMENNLHILVSLMTAYGLNALHQSQSISKGSLLAVLIQPWVRFENLAISGCYTMLLISAICWLTAAPPYLPFPPLLKLA